MKNVLIMIEDIMEDNSATDVLLEIAISMKEKHQKVALFIDNAQGGPVAERLRVKGVPVFDLVHGCYASMEKKYDVLLAFDEWSITKATLFEGKEKIKVGEKSDPENIINRVMGSDGTFDEDEEEDESPVLLSDDEKIAKAAELVQCEKCGSDNTPDAAQCALCGHVLKIVQEEKPKTTIKPAAKGKKKPAAKGKGKAAKK
jgi:hypothetical protein